MPAFFILFALILMPVSHADFLGDFIDKVTGSETAEISVTAAVSETSQAVPTPIAAGKPLKHRAHIRILDKRTNRLEERTLKTTTPLTFDNLNISIQNCLRHHTQIGHHAAFMTIHEEDKTPEDSDELSEESLPVFSGWMMSAFPAVAALEHPRYDVRLVECQR